MYESAETTEGNVLLSDEILKKAIDPVTRRFQKKAAMLKGSNNN
jgi:hypothetical protein